MLKVQKQFFAESHCRHQCFISAALYSQFAKVALEDPLSFINTIEVDNGIASIIYPCHGAAQTFSNQSSVFRCAISHEGFCRLHTSPNNLSAANVTGSDADRCAIPRE